MNHTYIVTHFCLLHFWVRQVEKMRAAGLIKGGSLENAMVCRWRTICWKMLLVYLTLCRTAY
jgi:UDP-3-O-acyl-N-acetylglucosamine deacetylase